MSDEYFSDLHYRYMENEILQKNSATGQGCGQSKDHDLSDGHESGLPCGLTSTAGTPHNWNDSKESNTTDVISTLRYEHDNSNSDSLSHSTNSALGISDDPNFTD